MALLEKWNPSRDLEQLRYEFDDLLEHVGFGLLKEWQTQTTSLRPAIESYADGDKFTVRVELPGVDPKDVDIKVAGSVLTVKGSREEKHETIILRINNDIAPSWPGCQAGAAGVLVRQRGRGILNFRRPSYLPRASWLRRSESEP